ncbi:efflux RND transporter periplasmic adaptor subunit [Microbulbifer elongatus]|uniref:efflux RND transporter periplasmic adaptor subunit n=1 Tax=Microbulbifer elongatus TaxID=86173 RepID=UPI001E3EA70F|nr:efflux RND transporter periplasmic adaptor subunit [Microbulbifer elongatus]
MRKKFVCLILSGAALVACGKSQQEPAAGERSAPPAPEVAVVSITEQPLVLEQTLPARVAPLRIAEVRPQVSGIIEKRHFNEGSQVSAGDLLYTINSDDYEVQVVRTQADLAGARARLKNLQSEAERYGDLVKTRGVSRQQNERAQAEYQQGRADVQAAEAALQQARLNLSRTQIRAPIAGHISRTWLTEGALVSADQSQPLASIQQLDPIYIDIVQPAQQWLETRQKRVSGALQSAGDEVTVAIAGAEYTHRGNLRAEDASVSSETGVVTLRAEFPNPDGLLLPGMFVQAKIQAGIAPGVALVPQQAVHFNGRGEAQVWIVGDDQSVALRPVQLLASRGDHWALESGVSAGEQLLVEGSFKVYPGLAVNPVPWNPESTGEELASAASPVESRK